MSLPELATPIRIYWDLTPLPPEPPDHLKIADDIIDLKILNLDIVATGKIIPDSCFAVLSRCAAARIPVTLTASPAAMTDSANSALAAAPPKELLLEVTSLLQLKTVTPLPQQAAGVSFPLCDGNWQQIPELIRLASANGFKHLVLPMQRLYSGEPPFHLPAAGLAKIADNLASFHPAPELRITAHDPFVWRAIFPNRPFPNGRCQAANTMLSIDPLGIVYPCPVMPVPLGDLKDQTLKEIARGEIKRELRSRLLRLPAECMECVMAESCKGGCRGRGERIFSSWDGIDPGCR